jgi:hypothetical protein
MDAEETRVVRIEVDPGLLLGTVFVSKGQTAAVPRSRADVLLKDKHASEADGPPDFADLHPQPTEKQLATQEAKEAARANAAASKLIDWPGYAELNKGGILTVDQLRTYIAENGTLWAEKLALSDDDVEAIDKKLKKLTGTSKAKAKDETAENETAENE